MKMMIYSSILAFLLFSCGQPGNTRAALAQATQQGLEQLDTAPEQGPDDAVIAWDKTVHDFGDVSVTDGALSCSFTVTNNGKDPIAIFEVVSSCGCTDVKWTREPIMPGQSGTVSATYKNEDGPLPFDKTLTVYISGVKRPVVLRLRGVVHEKKKSLSQLFGAQKLGDFGIKERALKGGTLRQGLAVSETATVANLGKKPLQVHFTGVSPQLSLSVSPNPIPAGSTATLAWTVQASPELYGRNIYTATPVLNGSKAAESLSFTVFTQENFATWTQEQRDQAALPLFESSTVSFGVAKSGERLDIVFNCTNQGKSALHFYKADSQDPALSLNGEPADIQPGKKGSIRFTLDTSLLSDGDNVIMLTLTTNSPMRPLVNLFVAGEIR